MGRIKMKPGQRVRIKSAPDQVGVLTDEYVDLGGKRRWTVQFPREARRLPEGNLEAVEGNESIESLLNKKMFGDSVNLRRSITHARLSGRLADVIYSMEATNTDFYAYQFKPVLNFLDSPSNGILIADEVGLGKTIEAGLIWTELKVREEAKRLLIICPAVLRFKWKSELSHRFGINAEICDSEDLLARINDTTRQNASFAIIASMQGLRPPSNWQDEKNDKKSARLARFIHEESISKELFDCVIFDEAHYMRNPESQTHELGKLIRPAAKNVVMLSATPIQLKSDDLFSLLSIIDNENFQFKSSFESVLKANAPIMEMVNVLKDRNFNRRLFLEKIDDALTQPLLKDSRQLLELKHNLPDDEVLNDQNYKSILLNRLERINLLGSLINRTRKRDVQENRVIRQPVAPHIVMSELESKFYQDVTEEIRDYCDRYDLFEGFILTIPQRQMCSSIPASYRAWKKKIADQDEEIILNTAGDDFYPFEIEKKSGSTLGPLITKLASIANKTDCYDELRINDSKYKYLLNAIRDYTSDKKNKKILLFSFYRETLIYLHERLIEDGVKSAILMGGMQDKKEKIIEQFERTKDIDILLASEVLSEGVDLQFCSFIINYDLPWNPMRVEQRIGRIDRIGQKEEKIIILNLFYGDTLDDRIYERLYKRLDIFKYALGDIESILGDKIRRLTFDLLTHKLTKDQENKRIEQTASAIANERQNQERLENEAAGLVAHGDYVLDKVAAAKEMRRYIDGKNIYTYLRDFLQIKYQGSRIIELNSDPLVAEIELSMECKSDFKAFLLASGSVFNTGLATSATGVGLKCLFYNNVDRAKTDYEVINQQHPIVQFAASNTSNNEFHQLVATSIKQINSGLTVGKYFFLIKLWSSKGAKTQENLIYRAINLETGFELNHSDAESLVMNVVSDGADWANAKYDVSDKEITSCYERLENQMDDEFDAFNHQMILENEDRTDFLVNTVKARFKSQISNYENQIEKFKISGREELIKLPQGKIRKLSERLEQLVYEYNLKRNVSSEPKDVIAGVVHVE